MDYDRVTVDTGLFRCHIKDWNELELERDNYREALELIYKDTDLSDTSREIITQVLIKHTEGNKNNA